MANSLELKHTFAFSADILGIPLGQWIMKDREAFQIKTLATLHNAILFFLSLYMSVECIQQVCTKSLWIGCTSGLYSRSFL